MSIKNKVAAGGFGMMIMTLVASILGMHHITLDAPTVLSGAGVLTFILQFMVPDADPTLPITIQAVPSLSMPSVEVPVVTSVPPKS